MSNDSYRWSADNRDDWVRLPQAIICDVSLRHPWVAAYGYLLSHILRKGGVCFVSAATAQREFGLAPRTYSQYVMELELRGLVTVRRNRMRPVEVALVPLSQIYLAPDKHCCGIRRRGEPVGKGVKPAFARMPYTVLFRRDLNALDKRVYGFLEAKWSLSPTCYARTIDIANEIGSGRESVKASLRRLRSAGFVESGPNPRWDVKGLALRRPAPAPDSVDA